MTKIPGEQDPRVQDVVAEWNGSYFVNGDLSELEQADRYSDVILLKQNDFESPVQQLVIVANRQPIDQDRVACVYNAEIDIEPLDAGSWKNFLDYLRVPESQFAWQDDVVQLVPSAQEDHTYYLLSRRGKYWLAIDFNASMPHAHIRTFPEGGSPGSTLDIGTEAQLTQRFFLMNVIRVMDFVSGIRDRNPVDHRLARTYVLGRSASSERNKPAPPGQRPLAIEGPKRELSVHKATGKTALGPAALPWHPELVEANDDRLMFKDIGGMWEVKEALQQLVMLRKYPEIQERWGVAPASGVLLHGPTGNGKTMAINALANELEALLINVKGSEIASKWIGDTERNLELRFNQVQNIKGPVVLFFDEIDAILASSDTNPERAAAVGAFKRRSQTLPPNVILAAATNRFDKIDPAIVASSRFGLQFFVGDPDQAARADILAQQVDLSSDLDDLLDQQFGIPRRQPQKSQLFDTDLDLLAAARATEGFNGTALALIFKNLRSQKAMQEAMQRAHDVAEADIHVTPISQADVMREIENLRRRGQIH